MDLESRNRWVEYSRAKDEMFVHTDIPEAPWNVVESDIKRNARINCMSHLLSTVPYEHVEGRRVKLPKRQDDTGYVRPPRDTNTLRARRIRGSCSRPRGRSPARADRQARFAAAAPLPPPRLRMPAA